jgi:hypothetical protein
MGIGAGAGADDVLEPRGLLVPELSAEGFQVTEPLVPGDEAGVGDGVGRPGEEVGEADWSANRAW